MSLPHHLIHYLGGSFIQGKMLSNFIIYFSLPCLIIADITPPHKPHHHHQMQQTEPWLQTPKLGSNSEVGSNWPKTFNHRISGSWQPTTIFTNVFLSSLFLNVLKLPSPLSQYFYKLAFSLWLHEQTFIFSPSWARMLETSLAQTPQDG